MARVFVSYRHVDGPFGVGWIAERLQSLDEVQGVQATFHDESLRAGDDFPHVLETEIEKCDLVIAVIGPSWLGSSDNGRARIEDPDDWVVREIETALRLKTRVMPLLTGGAEHPLASQVHPSIAPLTRLHAIPFRGRDDLEKVVGQVKSHLAEIDRQRAMRANLHERIDVPQPADGEPVPVGADDERSRGLGGSSGPCLHIPRRRPPPIGSLVGRPHAGRLQDEAASRSPRSRPFGAARHL